MPVFPTINSFIRNPKLGCKLYLGQLHELPKFTDKVANLWLLQPQSCFRCYVRNDAIRFWRLCILAGLLSDYDVRHIGHQPTKIQNLSMGGAIRTTNEVFKLELIVWLKQCFSHKNF